MQGAGICVSIHKVPAVSSNHPSSQIGSLDKMGTSWRTGLRVSKILQSLLEHWIPGILAHMRQNGWLFAHTAKSTAKSISIPTNLSTGDATQVSQDSNVDPFDLRSFLVPTEEQLASPGPSLENLLSCFGYFSPNSVEAAHFADYGDFAASHGYTPATPSIFRPPSAFSHNSQLFHDPELETIPAFKSSNDAAGIG